MDHTDKQPVDPKRYEKIRQAFIHFGMRVAKAPQIEMAECKTCGGEHPVDVLMDIQRASERVRRRKARR